MSGNSIGTLFTVTTFGESHGPALGCIVDGCPPGLELSEADIQLDLDRRVARRLESSSSPSQDSSGLDCRLVAPDGNGRDARSVSVTIDPCE